MACWLAPAVAAEYLGIPVGEVWSRVNAGHYPTRHDGGFQFIDVMPEQQIATPSYMAVTGEELAELTQPLALFAAEIQSTDIDATETEWQEEESDAPSYAMADWQQARAEAASQRKRPAA